MSLPPFRPMLLARFDEPFDHLDWLFEVKYDGFRALAHLDVGTVRLVSRQGKVFQTFPELCRNLAACLPVESAVLDGEIVYLGRDGRPDFHSLIRRRSTQYFYALDLLWLDGRDLRALPLCQRKQTLRRLIPPQPAAVLNADHVVERGVDLFRAVCAMDLEGIVGKWQHGR